MVNKIVKEQKLYRGYEDFNYNTLIDNIKGEGFCCYNYTNSFEFAKEYGNIIVEFEVINNELDIIEEDGGRKLYNPYDYDDLIEKNKVDGYRWFVSEGKFYNNFDKVYHYRIVKDRLKVNKIYYISSNLKE